MRSGSDVSDLLHRIGWATTVEDVWSMLVDGMAEFGFDFLLYAGTRFRLSTAVGDASDALILSNYPKSFMDTYVGTGMFKNAPLVRWAAGHTGVRSWRQVQKDAAEGRLTEPELRVVEFNRTHGARAGYAIAFPRNSPRDSYGLGLAASDLTQQAVDDLWASRGQDIELIATMAHLKLISLPHGDHITALTLRQRQVLELVADGKTVQDVAVLIQRNPATVEKHLRLARDALGVETTAQAVLKVGMHNSFFTFPAHDTPT